MFQVLLSCRVDRYNNGCDTLHTESNTITYSLLKDDCLVRPTCAANVSLYATLLAGTQLTTFHCREHDAQCKQPNLIIKQNGCPNC